MENFNTFSTGLWKTIVLFPQGCGKLLEDDCLYSEGSHYQLSEGSHYQLTVTQRLKTPRKGTVL